MTATLSSLQALKTKYQDIPLEAIIKQDILRLGIYFSEDSLRIASGFKPKDYFIFSFDLVTLEDMEQNTSHLLKAPEEVRLFGGEMDLKPTIINVRVNPKSPYSVEILEGKLYLYCEGKPCSEVEYHPLPDYYGSELSSGKMISEITPVLEWGYLIYLTVYRLCQYWGKDEECQFCDINENYRQQKKAGREYTGVKKLEDILEALELIRQKDNVSRAITIGGGSITSQLKGQSEIEFYLQYTKAIKEKFGDRWIIKANLEAFEQEDCRRLLTEGGVDIYHPNYEVWDPKLFKEICPGKERFIGRDNWMNRIIDAAEVFGPANVIPNFVAGIEMAQPMGFTDLHEAVESTREGLEFFMSRSVMPRFTTWCPEPLAFLKNQTPPPLEFYVKLLRVWRDTKEKYQLPNPPGYGEPGVGKAVFSVSAFMDVIR
ncbi:MAG: radical SAM protein [SAR324 cluster bacterium]|uniref:Radical SAM protein n=1 Tax=SAR324 cluster bacterium TaxID=2024889 RepID=A0A2A4TAQ2_9DELT|nr:MAG: radical SAM protein [SAR324 cluster bacterium]